MVTLITNTIKKIFLTIFFSFMLTPVYSSALSTGNDLIAQLFPEQFTPEQIDALDKEATFTLGDKIFTVEATYNGTKPNNIQLITGTLKARSGYIKRISTYRLAEGAIFASYKFTSPYTVSNNVVFEVKVTSPKLLVKNLLSSVLGEHDWFNPTGLRPLSESFFIQIKKINQTWVERTGHPIRLNGNMQDWLLVLKALEGEAIHTMEEEARMAYGQELYVSYLESKGLQFQEEVPLEIAQYVEINNDLREKIFAHFHLSLSDIPEELDKNELAEKKYFIVHTGTDVLVVKNHD